MKVSNRPGRTPPNLDVYLETDDCVIGVESKFLEYLTRKICYPAFSHLRYRYNLSF